MLKTILAALVAAFLCGTALAAGARLFGPEVNEASLNAAEKGQLAATRTATAKLKFRPFVSDGTVLPLFPAALGSGVVIVSVPGNGEVEFTRVPIPVPGGRPGEVQWFGRAAGWPQTGEVHFVYTPEEGLSGGLRWRGKGYSFATLPGSRHVLMREDAPPPRGEVLDDTPRQPKAAKKGQP